MSTLKDLLLFSHNNIWCEINQSADIIRHKPEVQGLPPTEWSYIIYSTSFHFYSYNDVASDCIFHSPRKYNQISTHSDRYFTVVRCIVNFSFWLAASLTVYEQLYEGILLPGGWNHSQFSLGDLKVASGFISQTKQAETFLNLHF